MLLFSVLNPLKLWSKLFLFLEFLMFERIVITFFWLDLPAPISFFLLFKCDKFDELLVLGQTFYLWFSKWGSSFIEWGDLSNCFSLDGLDVYWLGWYVLWGLVFLLAKYWESWIMLWVDDDLCLCWFWLKLFLYCLMHWNGWLLIVSPFEFIKINVIK